MNTGLFGSHSEFLDNPAYLHLAVAGVMTAVHTFNPNDPGPPFIIGANATDQLVPGLNADQLDGFEASAFSLTGHNHDHGGLTGLGDDDHTQYVHVSSSRTIDAQHTFAFTGPPFVLAAGAQGQKVIGLDADTVDGKSASQFVQGGVSLPTGKDIFKDISLTTLRFRSIIDSTNILAVENANDVTLSVSPQGAGSGLDADLLDGSHASAFASSGHDHDGTYLRLGTDDTVTAQPSFSPGVAQPPFLLGANAQGQKVVGLNADQIDGISSSGFIQGGTQLGTGADIFKDESGTSLRFRSVIGGTNITATENVNDVTFAVSPQGAGSSLDSDTVDGSHASAFATSGHSHAINDLTDVTITSVADDDILRYDTASGQWKNEVLSGAGEVNTASNVGAGSGLFKQKTGVDLEFRSAIGGTNVTATQNVNDVTFAVSPQGAGSSLDADTVDGSHASAFASSGHDHDGTYVRLGTADTITARHTFNPASPGVSPFLLGANAVGALVSGLNADEVDGQNASDFIQGGTQLGTGADIFKDQSGTDLRFRSIIAGTRLTAVENVNDVTINFDGMNLGNLDNVSLAGVADGDTLTFDGTSWVDTPLTNIGTGAKVYKFDTTAQEHQHRTIKGSGSITVTESATEITIS